LFKFVVVKAAVVLQTHTAIMSLAFQDVLNDAKKLSNRLSEHDNAADALVTQMQAVYQQVEAMKQVTF